MANNYLEFLEDLREPIRLHAGLPIGSVIVLAQQDMASAIAEAVHLSAGAAVLLGLTGGRSEVERKAALNAVENTLEVEVWTLAQQTSGEAWTTMGLAEQLQAFLHGYRMTGVPAINGGAKVPRFRSWALREENDAGRGTAYLVANLQFEVLLNPSAD